MRFYFHVSDTTTDTFNPDWSGREFDDEAAALSHAQSLRSELLNDEEFHGFVIVSNDNEVKVGALAV